MKRNESMRRRRGTFSSAYFRFQPLFILITQIARNSYVLFAQLPEKTTVFASIRFYFFRSQKQEGTDYLDQSQSKIQFFVGFLGFLD